MLKGERKTQIGNVLLVGVAIAIVLLTFEVALRVVEPVSDVRVLTESITTRGAYLELRPGARGLMLGRPVSINEDGYRGPLRSRAKPPGVVRLLVLGDSHTFSMGADNESAYPAVMERNLNRGGTCCEVLNFGVPGHDLKQMLTLFEHRGLAYDPDIVLVTFHTGDILESPDDAVPGERAGDSTRESWWYRFKVEALRQSYLARLTIPYGASLLRAAFGWSGGVTHAEQREIETEGAAWRGLRTRLLALKGDLDKRGITLAFVLFPSMLPFENHPARGEFNALAAWLKANGIPVIDLLPRFAGQRAWALTASLLDKHPNEAAYAIAGEAAAEFFANLVRQRRRSGGG